MNHHKNCLSITVNSGPCNCADLETVTVCSDCYARVSEIGPSCDAISACSGCGNIEQDTEEWSQERFEEEGYVV